PAPPPTPSSSARTALTKIATLLVTVVVAEFHASTPAVINGRVMNEVPADAYFALREAEQIAADTPATGFPTTLGQYVTHRTTYDLPTSLLPGGPVLIAREGDLFARLLLVHRHLVQATADTQVAELLELAFRLHRKHNDLARSLMVNAARPANRPATPTVVSIPTPATAMALSRRPRRSTARPSPTASRTAACPATPPSTRPRTPLTGWCPTSARPSPPARRTRTAAATAPGSCTTPTPDPHRPGWARRKPRPRPTPPARARRTP
ncbi:hypothetical protein LUR56_39745, partial [Streptomyces sp. MT29]|nr:hypothetical protein [Streptomyces sp. MT29]